MKNFFYLICVACLLTSCISGKRSTAAKKNTTRNSSSDPRFLDNISITPGGPPASTAKETGTNKKHAPTPETAFSSETEKCSALQFKYAIITGSEVEKMTDRKLVYFIEDWYGVPYKYGGSTKAGIDCSAFSSRMLDSVYNVRVPRTCREQYHDGRKVSKEDLIVGDLVFFNTSSKISHVGVFLGNNKFVHASTSSGVMISDLDDTYFKRRYAGSARFR